MMKNPNKVFLLLLISGLIWSCQSPEELLPINASQDGEAAELNLAGDENARKENKTSYGAFLTGAEEVPAVMAVGSGTAHFQLKNNGSAIDYEIKVANTTNIVAGHIHFSPFGQIGGVVVNLLPPGLPSGLLNGVIATGTITSADLRGSFAGEPLATLIMALNDGNAYVNIHTNAHPGGEIRGQISEIKPSDNGNYTTQLSGSEEVPSRDSKGRGVAIIKFNADNSSMSYKVNVANVENVRFAHIHLAKKGVNGGVTVDLRLDKVLGPVNGVYAQGIVSSENLKGLLLGGDLEMLREAIRTGNAYVNVHTDKFPPGEIRGQL